MSGRHLRAFHETIRPPLGNGTATAALLCGLALALAACSREVAGGSIDGSAIFASACATCHGADGTPPASMVAQLRVRDLRSAEFRARVSPELVANQVRHGSANKLMPSFAGALSEAQILAVAAYVAGTVSK